MLCALCLSIFRERRPEFEWPDGFLHLQKASKAGCKICHGLLGMEWMIPDDRKFSCSFDFEAENHYLLKINVMLTDSKSNLTSFHLVRNDSAQIPEEYPVFLHRASLDLASEPWRVRPDGFQKPIPSSTGDPRVSELALHWMESCLSSHKACPPYQHPSAYPKRLIEACGSRPRLIVSEEEPPDGHYATLSHCWGKNATFFTLTQSRLESLKHGLPLQMLPQTFQDAITLVRRLKIPYLWIDSLCIIQDSDQDWLEHAQKMASIYEGCVLNIAVDHAANPFAGIFRERNPDRVQECNVLWNRPEGREEVWTVFDESTDIIDGQPLDGTRGLCPKPLPLQTRAWVFQERLLAPRVLHFGTNSIYWSCKTIPSCCEASPTSSKSWAPEETLFSIVPDPPIHATRIRAAEYHCELRRLFHVLIEEYSGLELTKPDQDKLVAFAGIARRVGSIDYYSNQYFGGFFKRDLPADLTWSKARLRETGNSQSYLAPTWSWASLDSPVMTFPWHWRPSVSDLVTLAEVQSISVTYVDPSNRYGQVKSAQLTLLGTLIPCRSSAITNLYGQVYYAYLQDEAEPSNAIGGFWPDMRDGTSYKGRQFICPIIKLHYPYSPTVEHIRGIVLQKANDGLSYERLGYFGTEWGPVDKENLDRLITFSKKQVITIV